MKTSSVQIVHRSIKDDFRHPVPGRVMLISLRRQEEHLVLRHSVQESTQGGQSRHVTHAHAQQQDAVRHPVADALQHGPCHEARHGVT